MKYSLILACLVSAITAVYSAPVALPAPGTIQCNGRQVFGHFNPVVQPGINDNHHHHRSAAPLADPEPEQVKDASKGWIDHTWPDETNVRPTGHHEVKLPKEPTPPRKELKKVPQLSAPAVTKETQNFLEGSKASAKAEDKSAIKETGHHRSLAKRHHSVEMKKNEREFDVVTREFLQMLEGHSHDNDFIPSIRGLDAIKLNNAAIDTPYKEGGLKGLSKRLFGHADAEEHHKAKRCEANISEGEDGSVEEPVITDASSALTPRRGPLVSSSSKGPRAEEAETSSDAPASDSTTSSIISTPLSGLKNAANWAKAVFSTPEPVMTPQDIQDRQRVNDEILANGGFVQGDRGEQFRKGTWWKGDY